MEKIYKETFIGLFKKPREVFQSTIDNKLDKYQVLLLILGGISNALGKAIGSGNSDSLGLFGTLIVCIIAGTLFGWLGVYIMSGLLSFTGKWINGRARTNDILNIVSYASVPMIFTIVIDIIYLFTFGGNLFQKNINLYVLGLTSYLIYIVGFIIILVLGIYYLVFLIIGLSVVQGFSIGKSLLNLLFAALIIVIPFLLIVLAIGLFR